ncbi:hypothetical protein ILUMI_02769 [Ignelater luminosus]|uniref:CCAAT-binding factor domain-containing protein n=1 Tax=Ignelater luminosus TaxID=2038154 RepID=A0A8K0DFW2_IGNLU|nr:hypothetical protein ILUMI_02769 [Ignelater luminosus]
MEERDPLKSNAINSSLWEIQTLQNHVLPSVATAARFINSPLPSVEWDFTKILDNTGDDIFDKEIKKNTTKLFKTKLDITYNKHSLNLQGVPVMHGNIFTDDS